VQLNYLQEYSPPAEEFLPERAVLLLRSALTERQDIAPWLERMHTTAAIGMLKRLEEGKGMQTDYTDRLTRYNQLLALMGAYDLESNRDFQDPQPGMISRTAVEHPDPVCRQTAALAVMAGYGAEALKRLKTTAQDSGHRAERIAELQGTLAEGAQSLHIYQQEMEPGKLGRHRLTELDSLLDKFRVWMERVELALPSKSDNADLVTSFNQVRQLLERLDQDLTAGRLDNLNREERSELFSEIIQALRQLRKLIDDQSADSREHLGLNTLENYIQSFERLKTWIDNVPVDVENLKARQVELQNISNSITETIKNLPSRSEKTRIWWWRFRKRFKYDWRYIRTIILGGALGGGLGLGILRALLSIILWQIPGFWFYNYFPNGFIIGAGISLGLLMTNIVKLAPPEHNPWAAGRRSFWLSLGFGASFFTIANIIVYFILDPRSIFSISIVLPLTFLAGIGICLVVFDQPMSGWRIGARRWLVRLTGVASIFASIQIIFVLAEELDIGSMLVFGWSGSFYRSYLDRPLGFLGLEDLMKISNWYNYASVIDSALTGIALAVGITMGMILASQNYQRRVRRARQAGL
jgi:hypothetical protein